LLLKHIAPDGLTRAVDWKSRFIALGFDPASAWRASLSRSMRRALVDSRIEHLPANLRRRADVVVDIGANLGQWISAFMVFAEVKQLEAFEPNPEAFAALHSALGKRPATRLHNFALGEAPTTCNLNVTYSSGMSSFLQPTEAIKTAYAPAADIVKQVAVDVMRLDDFFDPGTRIDLMKIDVQGVEHSVLRGARKTLKQTRAILIETNFTSHYVGDGSFGTLHHQLTEELGFDFWDVSPPYRSPTGQALWADAVFLNREWQA